MSLSSVHSLEPRVCRDPGAHCGKHPQSLHTPQRQRWLAWVGGWSCEKAKGCGDNCHCHRILRGAQSPGPRRRGKGRRGNQGFQSPLDLSQTGIFYQRCSFWKFGSLELERQRPIYIVQIHKWGLSRLPVCHPQSLSVCPSIQMGSRRKVGEALGRPVAAFPSTPSLSLGRELVGSGTQRGGDTACFS